MVIKTTELGYKCNGEIKDANGTKIYTKNWKHCSTVYFWVLLML